ncbi:MAG: Hsp20/alpha crystallin family protein [Anaerolineales bacterium]|nr:Hsp20/alpha crystallin family protein [Anaerolineales bacterium]MCX7607948.1 Hsp20/alpha crystallin family protein [Anaerolineales bacterium]MDW8227882.1 Hsp20/alpha crystallin family protein [Anaerolineales bacterium]
MSSLIRWEPMREMMTLREAMDRLFDEAFTRPLTLSGFAPMPAIDMYQTDDEIVVRAALPGLKPEDVQLSVTNGMLILRGEFKQKEEKKEATWHIREHRYGSFERALALPVDVETEKARAEFEDGILTIVLPKAEAVKPKTISIKVK